MNSSEKPMAFEFFKKNFMINFESWFLEVNVIPVKGYRIFRQDRDKYGGGVMFYINQNIPCKKIGTFQ